MPRRIPSFFRSALAAASLLLAATGFAQDFKPALIFDEGGRGDRSFNDSAYEGLNRAATELKFTPEFAEPSQGSDRAMFLHQYSSMGFDPVIGVGFLFSEDIRGVATEAPDTRFICIDYAPLEGEQIAPNLAAIRFREHEGSFVVGALAAMMTKSNVIGFVGGAEGPLIRKFEKGYTAGAKHVKPDITVLSAYAGTTGAAFSNPAKGTELATSMIDGKADIIYSAAGTTNFGVFKACKERKIFAIGVDSDQSDPKEYPDVILTSMLKRTDNALYQVLLEAHAGKPIGGLREFGLKEEGVGYVLNESNKHLIPQDVVDKMEALKKEIIDGKIEVPFQ